MEPKEILEKLLELSELFKLLYNGVPEKENEPAKIRLCAIDCDNVHIFNGINALADACGQELSKQPFPAGGSPFEYSFDYRGKRFFQLDTDPPERMA